MSGKPVECKEVLRISGNPLGKEIDQGNHLKLARMQQTPIPFEIELIENKSPAGNEK